MTKRTVGAGARGTQNRKANYYVRGDGYHEMQPVVNTDSYGETHISNGVIHNSDGTYHSAYDLVDADMNDSVLAEALNASNPTEEQQRIIRQYLQNKGYDVTDENGNPLSATLLKWKYGGIFSEGLPSTDYLFNTKVTSGGKNPVAFTTGGGIRIN